MIVLDTSYLISIARGDPELLEKIELLNEEDVFLTAMAHFEIFRSGLKMGQKEKTFFQTCSALTKYYRLTQNHQEELQRFRRNWINWV